MTKEICALNDATLDYSSLTCDLGGDYPPVPVKPEPSLTPTAQARVERWANPPSLLIRSLEAHRDLLASQAFPSTAPRGADVWDRSPFEYSLWTLLPVACSHEPLNQVGGDGGSGPMDGGTTTPSDQPPIFTGQSVHSEIPCGADGMITDLDPGLGVCANYTTGEHHLFRWDATVPGSAESIIPLLYPPDQLLETASGRVYITTYQNPGLAWVDPNASSEGHVPFPTSLDMIGTSSSGRSVTSITPSFAKGLVELDSQIFVATSNLDLAHHDYLPGTVLAYRPSSGAFEVLKTSGYNPTGVAAVDGLLFVVSSGAIDKDGRATTQATLDVFDPSSHVRLRSIPLGTNGAGISGELSISEDGSTLVLPTSDNSGRLVVVDLDSLAVREIDLRSQGVSSSKIFFSSLQVSANGHYAWVNNFNDGQQYVIDLQSGLRVGNAITLDSDTTDARGLGDGILSGGKVFIGRGSQILGLSFNP